MGGFAATLTLRRRASFEGARALPPAAIAALASAAGTLLVIFIPGLHFAYRAPELRVALETTAALVALLTAGLVYGRFRRSSALDDLLLALAFGLLAQTNLLFAAGPIAFASGRAESFSSWATPIGQLAGAVVLGAASFAPPRKLRAPWRAQAGALAFMLGLFVATTALVLATHPGIPTSFLPTNDASHPHVVTNPTVLFLHVGALVAFAAAAVGYGRRAVGSHDSLVSTIAVGCVLAAFARVNYVLFPAFSTHWIYTADAYRLVFYLVVLGGAALEIRRYWKAAAEAAVLEERRRIARDLHDTVAQELAFIARSASRARQDPAFVERVIAAAERALNDSRRAVNALTKPLDEPVSLELEEALDEISDRLDCRVDISVADDVELRPDVRHALVRIACEAVTNAARHSGTDHVVVTVAAKDGLRMTIRDDGVGFDAAHPPVGGRGGFGLMSMRGWAEAVGARLQITSRAGLGTFVEVEVA